MMKFFAYILSVYIVVLTIMPCVDIHQDTISQNIELLTTSSNTHQTNSDHCSPFCTCTCCATSVVLQNTVIQFKCFPIDIEQLFEYDLSYSTSEYYSIWQPPKIG